MRVLFLLLISFVAVSARAEQVCSVHDGDTFRTCNGESIRVWGVDAPELKQPMGKDSRDYLSRLVSGREVDLNCVGKSYQRRVCRVSVWVRPGASLSVQREMVGHGLAYDSPKYSKGEFAEAEAFARSLNRGVWTLPGGGVRPWDWRKR